MSIGAIGSAPVALQLPEKVEGSGPDHDGDSDDAGVQAPVQSSPPPGAGTIIDKTA